jgi:hypothetical protein
VTLRHSAPRRRPRPLKTQQGAHPHRFVNSEALEFSCLIFGAFVKIYRKAVNSVNKLTEKANE